jgi:hypothetical protein
LMTTQWSGRSPGLYKIWLDSTMSSTTLLFEICKSINFQIENHAWNQNKLIHLFGPELHGVWEILSVIVAQMIVTDNRHGFDAGADQKVDQHRLELGLARLKVVAAQKGSIPFSQLSASRHKGVLGRTVDISALGKYFSITNII